VNNVEQSLLLAEIADQRYYNSNAGRFYTPDPGGIKTADPKNPTSWNRYAYAGGDPVNRYDPYGLYDCDPSTTCSPTPSGPSISIDGGSPIGQIYYGCDYYCQIGGTLRRPLWRRMRHNKPLRPSRRRVVTR
jgi:RHS repeat-associated protein